MRFTEFNILNEQEQPGYYAVGDSTAYNLAMSGGPWKSLAQPGAMSTNPIHKSNLDSIPAGSVVAIALGADDAAKSIDIPEQIALRVNSLVSYAKGKGQQVILVLFPSNINQNVERNKQVKDALESQVNAPMLDMESPSGTANYGTITSQIMQYLKPTSGAVQKAAAAPATSGQAAKERPLSTKVDMSAAKTSAEKYLGRTMSPKEWDYLIRATNAEASPNTKEQGWVMGTILNRVNKGTWGNNVISVLQAKNQFQSVTGTPRNRRPSPNFSNGPNESRLNSILTAAVQVLPSVPHNIINFTAASRAAYGPGTNIGYLKTLYARGGEKIGGTVFSA